MKCVWCESDVKPNKKGFMYFHLECFEDFDGITCDTKKIKELLLNDNQKDDTVRRYLERMENFELKWNNSIKALINK